MIKIKWTHHFLQTSKNIEKLNKGGGLYSYMGSYLKSINFSNTIRRSSMIKIIIFNFEVFVE